MIRIIIIYILPLLAPTVIYFIWRKKTKRQDIPWIILLILGLFLLGLSAGAYTLLERSPAGSVYTAPKFINGEIVPAVLDTNK